MRRPWCSDSATRRWLLFLPCPPAASDSSKMEEEEAAAPGRHARWLGVCEPIHAGVTHWARLSAEDLWCSAQIQGPRLTALLLLGHLRLAPRCRGSQPPARMQQGMRHTAGRQPSLRHYSHLSPLRRSPFCRCRLATLLERVSHSASQGSPNREPVGFLNRKNRIGIPVKPTGIPIGSY
jgi:hypothetical protein